MARSIVVLLITTYLFGYVTPLQYTEIVETTNGPVRGQEVSSYGVKFKAFKGVPYARAPIRELRFKAPQPPHQWSTVRNATKFGPICAQPILAWMARVQTNHPLIIRTFFSNTRNVVDSVLRMFQTSEDCLSLNVYTTQLGDKGLKPVLVLIPGGAFVVGDGTDAIYGPELLLRKDIVVVTINYRLGILGFLSTNTTETPGNWGLKDQVAALRWVRDNIARFGGDPNQVTIYGQSAGGASVHFHLLSPLSKGLFHRAIVASASATCSWAVTDQQERLSRRLAQLLGASATDADDPRNRVAFLRKVNGIRMAYKIIDIFEEETGDTGIPDLIPFTPVVEPPGTKDAFLTEDPNILVAEGRFTKVPLMMGSTDLEGAALFQGLSTLRDASRMPTEACQILPVPLRKAIMEKNDCPKVTKQISDLYFGGKAYNSSLLSLIQVLGDTFLGYGIHGAQKAHARYAKKKSPAFFYFYTFDGDWKSLKNFLNVNLPGAVHGEDVNFVFKPKVVRQPKLEPTSPGHFNQERLLEFYANFVKFGNPTPTLSKAIPIFWEPALGGTLNIMHIGTNLTMENGVLTNRMDFWDGIYQKYIGTPIRR